MQLCQSVVCWIQWATYVPTLIGAFPLNLAALWILLFKIRRCTACTVYLANLVVNDCLLLLSLPFKIYAYERQWRLTSTFCSFLESLVFVNIYGSIALIMFISLDRYIVLQYPFKMRGLRSPWKAAVVCGAIWVLIFGASFPVYSLHENSDRCFQNFSSNTWDKVGIIVAMETFFLASAVIMIFCSVKVMKILQTMLKRNPEDMKLRSNKSVKIVLTNLITFLVCFIPYHIAALLYFVAKKSQYSEPTVHALREFVHISSCLSSMNCLFDGICYYFILKENWVSTIQEKRLSTKITLAPTHKAQTVSYCSKN